MSISQSLETINSTLFAGKTITVSYYARRGANYSATSNAFNCDVYTGTGTSENVALGYTGSAVSGQVLATLTTTWQRFSGSVNIPSTATEIGLYFNYTPTGTAGAADFVEITGVQLELGTTVTDFSRNGSTFQNELAACQRYYYRISSSASNLYAYMTPSGSASSSTSAAAVAVFPVQMRVVPTSLDFANLALTDNAANFAVSALTLNTATGSTLGMTLTVTSTGLTTSRFYFLVANNSSSAHLGLSAEL
jgi:hypothetical protein